jgi:membrane protein implicated in regulation of membrane protease activity
MKRSTWQYTIYSIIGTIVETGLLLAIMLWGLPILGVQIPPAGIAILLALVLSYSAYTYIMGRKALQKKLILELEAMIGQEGVVVTCLAPEGYVRIGNELWKAFCLEPVQIGNRVLVTGVQGLKITVAPIAS